jgi:hypothetical protein
VRAPGSLTSSACFVLLWLFAAGLFNAARERG